MAAVVETQIFQAGFEDVPLAKGGFRAVDSISGFTSLNGRVEVQHNPIGVGAAPQGQQHIELDGDTGMFVELAPNYGEVLRLQFDYSPRPGVSRSFNAVQVWFNGNLVRTISADGTSIRSAQFRPIVLPLDRNTRF